LSFGILEFWSAFHLAERNHFVKIFQYFLVNPRGLTANFGERFANSRGENLKISARDLRAKLTTASRSLIINNLRKRAEKCRKCKDFSWFYPTENHSTTPERKKKSAKSASFLRFVIVMS
jgi:hypothetical protein